MKCIVGFPLTLKCVTLNDPEMSFSVKICFLRRFVWILFRLAFEGNYVKTNEDTLILSVTKKCSPRTVDSADI